MLKNDTLKNGTSRIGLYGSTPPGEKQDKSSKLSKHLSPDSTPSRNEVIMKTTYPVNQESATKSVVIIKK